LRAARLAAAAPGLISYCLLVARFSFSLCPTCHRSRAGHSVPQCGE